MALAASGPRGPAPGVRVLGAEIRRREPSRRERRAWISPPEGLRRTLDAHLGRGAYHVVVVHAPVPARTASGRPTAATQRAARAFTARAAAAARATGRPALVAVHRGRHWVALFDVSPSGRSVTVLDPAGPAGRTMVRWGRWLPNYLTPVTAAPGRPTRAAGCWVALVPTARGRTSGGPRPPSA